MAEGWARRYLAERGRASELRSASVLGLEGVPVEANAAAVMAEVGVDIRDHHSTPLTREALEWADWVLVMEISHAQKARDLLPEAEGKVVLLGSLIGDLEIRDPMGGWKGRFRRTRDDLVRAVERFVDQLPPLPREP
jgi:protein-tyrosine-phosphatase